jgi:hypothetical protein
MPTFYATHIYNNIKQYDLIIIFVIYRNQYCLMVHRRRMTRTTNGCYQNNKIRVNSASHDVKQNNIINHVLGSIIQH